MNTTTHSLILDNDCGSRTRTDDFQNMGLAIYLCSIPPYISRRPLLQNRRLRNPLYTWYTGNSGPGPRTPMTSWLTIACPELSHVLFLCRVRTETLDNYESFIGTLYI